MAHGLIAGACLLAGVWMVFWAHGRWPHVLSAPFLVAGLSLLVLKRIARVPAPQEGKPIGPSGSWSGRISQAQGTALGAVLLLLSCVGFLMTPGTVAWRWSSVRAAEEFHEAVEKGQLNRLDELLAENPGALRAFELMGHDLLSWAAVNDQAEVARLLLQWDADPNAVSILGKRPLHCAAMRGSADVTALLLEEGADPNVRDFCGTTPLFDAAVEGHRGCRELLLENGARHDLLSAAAAGDVLALVRVLPLADLDARDLRGRTALHVSAASGHAVVVDALLDSGADIAAEDRWDRTPLMAAARNGRSEIADILLRRGADPDAADEKGMTALHSAAERGDAVTARLLVNAGASPNPVAENGLTPMFLAVGEGHDDIADLLEVHGVRKVARVIRVGP